MAEENKKDVQDFILSCSKEMEEEEKLLLEKKQYQITVKDTITHITTVIYNQATKEELKEYKNIEARVKEVIGIIENIIKEIMQAERKLNEIQKLLQEIVKNSEEDIPYTRVALLQSQITEYTAKKADIERSIQNNKVSFVLKELNFISDKISVNKQDLNSVELNVTAQSQEDFVNKIKRALQGDIIPESKEEKLQQQRVEVYSNQNIESNVSSPKEEVIKQEPEVRNVAITEEQKGEETNTLIISERTGNVYLPYTLSDIEYYLNHGYSSAEEVIKEVFTVPLKKYSNFAISRVIEGFKLMRERERAGFGESLKYALNLIFERKLHPAIITACRAQDDLDIYLACLEDNVLSLFDCFKIKFEYAPVKVRTDEKLQYFEGV